MQTSGSARKLHDTFRMLHVTVSSVLAPSQLIRNRCCTSSSSSSSCSRGGSSSCYGVLPTVGSTAAVSGNRLSGRLYATDAAVSSTAGQEAKQLEPALYVVGTPIGNLEDMSFRAIRILQGVSLILAEDTRHTRKLLEHFSIRTPTLSCHEHNERQRQELVLQRLQQGEAIALVSDAGMPAISDPGYIIVSAAVAAGVTVVPIPGPCAAVTALAAAGLLTEAFYFAGFLPPKAGKRKAALLQLQHLSATLVFYAPPHGLAAILADMADVLGPHRQAVVARELTKLHEEFYRGSLQQLLEEFGPEGRRAVKGEVVLLVSGCSTDEQQLLAMSAAAGSIASFDGTAAAVSGDSKEEMLQQLVLKQLAAGTSVSATAKVLSQQLQIPRSRVYKLALELSTAPGQAAETH